MSTPRLCHSQNKFDSIPSVAEEPVAQSGLPASLRIRHNRRGALRLLKGWIGPFLDQSNSSDVTKSVTSTRQRDIYASWGLTIPPAPRDDT